MFGFALDGLEDVRLRVDKEPFRVNLEVSGSAWVLHTVKSFGGPDFLPFLCKTMRADKKDMSERLPGCRVIRVDRCYVLRR